MRQILAGGRYLPPRLAEIAAAPINSGMIQPVRDAAAHIAERLTSR